MSVVVPFLLALRQELSEELIDHAPAGIDGLQPVRELRPTFAVRRDHVLLSHERALVQERDATALVRPLIERLQEISPRLLLFLARRVNGIERDDVAVPRVRRDE